MLSPWINVFLVFPRKSNMTFYLLALTVFMMQLLGPLLVPSLLAVQVLVYSRVFHNIFRLVRLVIFIGMFMISWLKLVNQII